MSICGIEQISVIQQDVTRAATTAVVLQGPENVVDITLDGNITTLNVSGGKEGDKVTFRLLQDGTGSRTVGWGSMFRFSTTYASPTLSTDADTMDRVSFQYNAASETYDCIEVNLEFA